MFVLKNAWAALGRVKWRTALIALLALLVSFSAAVDLAVIRADDTAIMRHTSRRKPLW